MTSGKVLLGSVVAGVIGVAMASSAQAQTTMAPGEIPAPEYGSCVTTCALSNGNFNTPESDGRPGVKFYYDGMTAYQHKDYEHAAYMLKVAASWAYKPAEYNLGIMYFRGMGVPVNRPLGTAWMFLAAERDTSEYVYARHLMVSDLDSAERTEAYALLQQLEKTYGDKVALRRAKVQWTHTKSSITGSRVGYTGDYVMVGSGNGARPPALYGKDASLPEAAGTPMSVNGWEVFKNGDVTDGSIAYRQFQQSNNPYDPIFIQNRGSATVGPLQQIKTDADKDSSSKKGNTTPSADSIHPPRNA
ncbi:MAG: hypothetical protein OJF55_001555 [Rhodanobacteraceae bacterium]|jgi:hypothetical protein|nr:MAG: hypothetical protein OJF55_001555 [Rhodanobacteraceae bacterium]